MEPPPSTVSLSDNRLKLKIFPTSILLSVFLMFLLSLGLYLNEIFGVKICCFEPVLFNNG